jgi:putative transposase
MMETVPTVRVVDGIDAVVLPDLPEEIAPAMSDIAGLAVTQTMFEAELTEACGLKGETQP